MPYYASEINAKKVIGGGEGHFGPILKWVVSARF